jgi:putative hydrolases of HD superfamily
MVKNLIEFTKFTFLLQQVERIVLIPGTGRHENDVEHSWQLAMIGWYLAELLKLPLNKDLLIKYALVHDAVEAYAGDTSFYHRTKKMTLDKIKREKKAALKLKKQFPRFREMHKLIHSYELKKDKESKFIYALDKIIPILNNIIDDGKTWKMQDITFEMLYNSKRSKIELSPELLPLFEELIALLKKNKKKLFNKK